MINGKPATDVLGEIEGGQFLRDLTKAFYDVTQAVRETRKSGRIKITISMSPTGKGSIEINAAIDTKEPEHDRPSTTFFLTPDGTLLRNDPNQPALPLREVTGATNEPVRIAE